jgi:hypothetical protein
MKTIKINPSILALFILIVAAAFLRVFIQIPNVTPVAAIALFGATYIKRRELAIILPLIILLISDLFLGMYSSVLMAGVYGSFILIAFLGFVLRRRINLITVAGASLASSVIFFLVTNFVVWAQGLWYPLSIEGLLSCYAMAIPFFRYEVIGTLVFSLFFFYTYALSTSRAFKLEQA